MEIFGSDIEEGRAAVGMGIHPWHDRSLVDDFEKVELLGDATEPHLYSVEWMPGRTNFFIDEQLVKTCAQAPSCPMQLMLNVYEFERVGQYPQRFHVAFVRGWSRAPAGNRGEAGRRAPGSGNRQCRCGHSPQCEQLESVRNS